jgi:signal peptidase I
MQDTDNSAAEAGGRAPGWLQLVLIGRRPKNTLLRILVLVALCAVTFQFILWPIQVDGISMEPTYHDRRICCVNRLAYWRQEPRRGDVVGIRFSDPGFFFKPNAMYMKRIIGLPGESVSFHAGHAYIDGQLLDEPYVKNPCDWEHAPILCGPDQYYVVGDNRSMPFENHKQGRAERIRIMGKVIL